MGQKLGAFRVEKNARCAKVGLLVRLCGPARRWRPRQDGAPGFRNATPYLPDVPARAQPCCGAGREFGIPERRSARPRSRMKSRTWHRVDMRSRAQLPTRRPMARRIPQEFCKTLKTARRPLGGRPNAPKRRRRHSVAGCLRTSAWPRCWTRFGCLARWPPNFLLGSVTFSLEVRGKKTRLRCRVYVARVRMCDMM